jgi:hypothetical protein
MVPKTPSCSSRFLCSPPDLYFLYTYFIFMYMHNNHCHRVTAHLQLNILLLLLLLLLSSSSSSSSSLYRLRLVDSEISVSPRAGQKTFLFTKRRNPLRDYTANTRDSSHWMKAAGTWNWPFLGAFAKMRKATINLIMSVSPSVRMEQLGWNNWTDLHEIWYLNILRKYVERSIIYLPHEKISSG